MFTGLKPYDAYTTTPRGQTPTTWGARRVKTLLSEVDRRSTTGSERLLSLRAGQGLVDHLDAGGKLFQPRDLVGYKVVHAGELVINRMRAATGVLALSDRSGLVSPDYATFDCRSVSDPRYLVTLLRSAPLSVEIRRRSRGMGTGESGFLRLYTDAFGAMSVPWPTGAEQAAIVKYLAHASARIDRAIASKRKLAKLLGEQQRVIINEAVTRGLNPSIRLKYSGDQSLGRVPEHWTIRSLKHVVDCLNAKRVPLSSMERGAMASRRYDYYGASGVIDSVDGYLFDEPLLLIAEDGANLVLRNLPLAIIARGKYWVNNHAHVLRPRAGSLEYLSYRLEQMDFRPWITGAAQPKLTQDRLMSVRIAMPPPDEQNFIAAVVQARLAPTNRVIAHLRDEVNLLREYQSRLTADVVTGQVDVREIAASLPDLDPQQIVRGDDAAHDEQLDEVDEELLDEVGA